MPVDAASEHRPPSAAPELSRQGDELFRQLFDSAPDAMLLVSNIGSIELVNLQTERLFGYPSVELVDQPIETLVPAQVWAAHDAQHSNIVDVAEPRSPGSGQESCARHKDGTRFPIEISSSPLHTRDGSWVSVTIRDVTRLRQIEAELDRARSSAETTSAARSESLSSLSHELRNPLNSILGFTQLLQRDKQTPPTERQREMLDHVLLGGEHLLRLIDDMFDRRLR